MTREPRPSMSVAYMRIYEQYKTHLSTQGDIPFSTYCANHHQPYKNIKSWLGVRGLSIKSIRNVLCTNSSPRTPIHESSPENIRLIPLSTSTYTNHSDQIVRNLRITLPCGTTLELAELEINSLKELIR